MARIFFGVTGSIAAYRAPDVVKALKAAGHDVQCVLTHSATQFTTAKTLETFSGRRVLSNDAESAEHQGTDHITWARWAEVFVVYGTTANFMAKLAGGFCDDFLSLQILATQVPVVLVPAMNVEMWQHPATQANCELLESRGIRFVGPIAGLLACGEEGLGHVAETSDVVKTVGLLTTPTQGLAFVGKKVFISLGAMKSDIDDVRFVQNKSSGRMGWELARAVRAQGAQVQLLVGDVSNEVDSELRAAGTQFTLNRFESFSDYRNQVEKLFPSSDLFISAAAVLDFEVVANPGKLERGAETSLSLQLKPTTDVVAWAAQSRAPHQRVVAFALEAGATWEDCIARALKKLRKKGADLIVVNRSGLATEGPGASTNSVVVVDPTGASLALQAGPKAALASELSELLGSFLQAEKPTAVSSEAINKIDHLKPDLQAN